MKQEINNLIIELQKYDNPEGYSLEYEEVKEKLNHFIEELISTHEERWSCRCALEILKKIKSEKSIPYLILFIEKNDNGNYWESCEDAMNALISIGKPAIPHLFESVKKNLANKKDYTFLTGALTEIKDERVYNFMIEIVEDYIKDYKKYDSWFNIHMFVADFDKQENKEILHFLKELATMDNLSKSEKNEILDTIK